MRLFEREYMDGKQASGLLLRLNITEVPSLRQGIIKECHSSVRGESVYLTMLSGHSRHTHSVSVPNISVLLHTHVEAVLKFEVVSHFAHF